MRGDYMYAIGIDKWNYLNIKQETLFQWDTNKLWNEIKQVNYKCNLNEATLFQDYETVSKIKEEIIKRKDEIIFENNNIIDALLDEQDGKQFDVSNLKIYELVPTEIRQEID
jgi:hypothetical protein